MTQHNCNTRPWWRKGYVGLLYDDAVQQSGSYVMLEDYDDFNAQHSNRSMQIVFEELIDTIGT